MTLAARRVLVAAVELAEGRVQHEVALQKTSEEASWNRDHRHHRHCFQAPAVSEVAEAAQQWKPRQEQVEVAHESCRIGTDHSHRHLELVHE